MNSLFKNMQINQLSGRLRQIAGTPNVLSMQFSAVDVAGIRESIITIANECKADDPQIARQLLAAKDNTIIAFPSVIFIKAPFTVMPYTITSKNSPKVVSGEIRITEDMQHQ